MPQQHSSNGTQKNTWKGVKTGVRHKGRGLNAVRRKSADALADQNGPSPIVVLKSIGESQRHLLWLLSLCVNSRQNIFDFRPFKVPLTWKSKDQEVSMAVNRTNRINRFQNSPEDSTLSCWLCGYSLWKSVHLYKYATYAMGYIGFTSSSQWAFNVNTFLFSLGCLLL